MELFDRFCSGDRHHDMRSKVFCLAPIVFSCRHVKHDGQGNVLVRHVSAKKNYFSKYFFSLKTLMALYPKAYFEALMRKGRANAIISVAGAEYIP